MGAVSRPLLMLLLCPLLFGLLSRLSVRAQQQSGVGDTPYWHLAGGTAPLQLTVLPAPWSPAQLTQSEPVLTSFSARSECLCRQACLVSLRCLSYVLGPGRLCRLYRRRGSPGALTTTAAGTDYHRTYFGYDWTTDTTTTATTSDGVLMYRAGVALPGDFCTDTGECTAAVSSAHCLEHRCFCLDSTDRVCASLLPNAGAESGTVEPGAAAIQTGDVTTGSGAVTAESTTPLVKTTAPSGQALTSENDTASTSHYHYRYIHRNENHYNDYVYICSHSSCHNYHNFCRH
ncbi:hypothetical protein FJT64_025300 [Amphibalanus amphitrite]|uniref:EB domain-containing protein n=1 Tax=Amphibalanus amphitrite TaxID=1232801 RepID=A0A6A4WG56_AMPAM|nr:hypothetical protein FJT64_025300 [Amphibalanus amphitrite]